MSKDKKEVKKRVIIDKNGVKRNAKGHILKGQSGNPSGRPKTHKLTQMDKNDLKKLITGKDISKVLEFLCERADTIDDAFRFIKEFAPYLAPKLQSTTNINRNDNRIEIKWKSEVDKMIRNVDEEYEKLTSQTDEGVIDVEIVEKDKV